MALIFCDGFDHYSTAELNLKWNVAINNLVIQNTIARNGGQAVYFAGNDPSLNKTLSNNSTNLIAGVAFYPTSFSSGIFGNGIFSFGYNGADQISIIPTITGGLQVVFNGFSNGWANSPNTVLGTTSSGLLNLNVWNYIEVQTNFTSAASGYVNINLNGQSAHTLSLTGIATLTSGSIPGINQVALGHSLSSNGDNSIYYDDFYLCDNTGTTNNTFLGDIKVITLTPSASGRLNQFTQTGGTTGGHYTAVNEIPADGDTSYVASSTVGNIEDYKLSTLPGVGAVYGIQVVAYVRKDDAGARSLAIGVGNGSTESFNSGSYLTESYQFYTNPLNTNPLTSANWSPTDFSTLQASLKIQS